MRADASTTIVRRPLTARIAVAFGLSTIMFVAGAGAAHAASSNEAAADDAAMMVDDPALAADLTISMTAETPLPYVDHSFTWTLHVTNNGPGSASSVTVSDVVPDAVSVLSVTSSDFSCLAVGNSVTCTRSELASGASGSIVIDVMVPDSLIPQVVDNDAHVTSSTPDPNPTNNAASSSVLTVVVLVGPPAVPPTDPTTAPTISTEPTISTTEPTTATSQSAPTDHTDHTDGIAPPQPAFTDRLPETGASSQPLWLIAAEALLLGAALVATSRRRRRPA